MNIQDLVVFTFSMVILIEMLIPLILHFVKLIYFSFSKQMDGQRRLMGDVFDLVSSTEKINENMVNNKVDTTKDDDNIGYT